MRYLKAVGAFVYDFVIGDDWKIAAAVVVALLVLGGALADHLFGDHGLAVLGGLLIMAGFVVSLLVDVRRSERRR
jgi:dipeptide/tripeptide permease